MEVITHVLIITIRDILSHINGKIVLLYVICFSKWFQSNLSLITRLTKVHGVIFVHRVLEAISLFKRSSLKLLLLSGCNTICRWMCYRFLNLVREAMYWSTLDQQHTGKLYQSLKNVFVKWVPGWKWMVKVSMVVFHGNIKMIQLIHMFGEFVLSIR